MIENVIVIFKTHLDIGFTDFAENIKNHYLQNYIPAAIKVGYELKGTDTPFIWTVGAWLIDEALKKDDGTLKKAIKDGIIRWHALPFTTHTELMSVNTFEAGLKISKKLDDQFEIKTTGCKMTDVPGHTIGIVPILKKYGIKMMHIGVNVATPMPNVPRLFRWKCGIDELTVVYNHGYGGRFANGKNLFVFAHTIDNTGPQTPEQIKLLYKTLAREYPGANITAGTLSDMAELIDTTDLPVVENEIGDTWIHGIGTDPKKLAAFKAIQRYTDKTNCDVPTDLMLVAEHTWGMDIKSFFKNTNDWFLKDFEKTKNDKSRKMVEASWQEQRTYIYNAAKALSFDLHKELSCEVPDLSDFSEISIPPVNFRIEWQIFSEMDYARFSNVYIQGSFDWWKMWDYTKVGLPKYKGFTIQAKPCKAYQKLNTTIYELHFEKSAELEYGLPYFYMIIKENRYDLRFFGKKANRLPQALWLKFMDINGTVEIHKMGQWINPKQILGSPLIMACDFGVRNKYWEIESLDAALVAPFGKHLLDYNIGKVKSDLYFNLYNNIWNTNFPMWYNENTKYRFNFIKRKTSLK